MKNKLLMLGIVFSLVFSLAFLAACGDSGDDEPEDQGTVVEEQPPTVPDPDPPAPPADPDPADDGDDDDAADPEPEDPGPPPIPRPAGVVYSLATDAWVQHLDVGTMGVANVLDPTPYLTEAGGPTWTVVEGPDGNNALQLTNRMETWNALDLQIPELGLDLNANTYMVTVTGSIAWGGVGQLGGADSPWGTFATAETDEDNNFAVNLLLDAAQVADLGERSWLRIASQCTNNLTINTVTVITMPNELPAGGAQIGSGALIQDLRVREHLHSAVTTIATNLSVGVEVYADRSNTFESLPASVLGAEFIQFAMAPPGEASDTLRVPPDAFIIFTAATDITVFVMLDDRGGPELDTWLPMGWLRTNLGQEISISGWNYTYWVYSQNFAAGDVVYIGPMGATNLMYSVWVVAQ